MAKRGPICQYYAKGLCKFGSDCCYRHAGEVQSKPVCTFWLAGRCAYSAEACRFAHGDPAASPAAAPSASTSSRPAAPAPAPSPAPAPAAVPAPAPAPATAPRMSHAAPVWSGGGRAGGGHAAPHGGGGGMSGPESVHVSGFMLPDELWGEDVKAEAGAWGDDWDEQEGWEEDALPEASWGDLHGEHGQEGEWADEQGWAGEAEEEGAYHGCSDPADLPLCSHFTATGDCPRGDSCHQIHGDFCETCGRHALHPYNPEEAEAHRHECERRHERLAARLRSAQVECGICLEQVLSKPQAADRRFGLLACEHSFCLRCIRSWRRNRTADVDTAVRTCPLCRKTTHFVVPSTVWPETPEEKEGIVGGYKDKLGAIDCRHFSEGAGTCPFGTSCFYRHVYPDGREEPKDPMLLRRYMGAEGEVRIVTGVRLSDFFDTPQGRAALGGGVGRGSRRPGE